MSSRPLSVIARSEGMNDKINRHSREGGNLALGSGQLHLTGRRGLIPDYLSQTSSSGMGLRQYKNMNDLSQQNIPPYKNWLSSHILWGYAFLGLVIGAAILLVYQVEYGSDKTGNEICIQMIQPARNPQTGEIRDFPTPCDVPAGWEKITEIDETGSWQTYRNDKIGFTLKYPETWKIVSDTSSQVVIHKQLAEPVGYDISILSDGTTLQELIDQNQESWGLLEKQEMLQFADKSATKFSFFGESGFSTDVIYIERDTMEPVIILTGPSPYEEINQILFTFRFLDN